MTYSNHKSNAMKTEPCKCGQVQPVYHPDENQYEPACWECYYNDVYDFEPSEFSDFIEPTQFWEPRRPSADEIVEDELPF